MSLGANLLSIFVPSYFLTVTYLDKEKAEMNFKVLDVFSNNMSVLKNGLSKEENEQLFVTTNVTEIIALVLKGLHTLGR